MPATAGRLANDKVDSPVNPWPMEQPAASTPPKPISRPPPGRQAARGVKAFPARRAAAKGCEKCTGEHARRQRQANAGLAANGQLQIEQGLGDRADKAQRGEPGRLELIDADMRAQPPPGGDQQTYEQGAAPLQGFWRRPGRSRA